MKKSMRSLIALLTAMALTAMMTVAVTSVAFAQNAEHCPDGWSEKVEAQNDELDDVVLDEGTMFCVKAGPEATGILEADGETTLLEYVEAAGITVGEGNVPSVSYYVIYEVPATDPPATDPPATDPPATDPPATDPPATDPPATDPPATDPPALTPPPTSMSDGGTGSGNILPVLLAGLLAAAFLFLRPAMRFSPVLRKR
jgi:hypothetical protein